MFIVDSIPVIDEPERGEGTLQNEDVDHLTVITNPDSIRLRGYTNFDKIIIVITKEYAKRPADIRAIPSTDLMNRQNGRWYLKGADKPYTGRYINYFYNGKIEQSGTLKDGLLNGQATVYYANGNKSFFRNYTDGIAEGYSEEYFPNGVIKQKGSFKQGKDDGIWQDFYSTGEIKRQTTFVDLKAQLSKDEEKFYSLQNKSIQLMQEEDYTGAIKKLNEAIILNSKYADAYLYRGTAKMNNLNFDDAITDFDKAIALEPLYMEALANRAFARIRKYEFKNSKVLSKSSEVTIMAAKDKVDIPVDEKSKICEDLTKSVELGDDKEMIFDAIERYCK